MKSRSSQEVVPPNEHVLVAGPVARIIGCPTSQKETFVRFVRLQAMPVRRVSDQWVNPMRLGASESEVSK